MSPHGTERRLSGSATLALVRNKADEVFEAAAALPTRERASLVVRLLDTIAAPDELATAHVGESLGRLEAARAGLIDLVDDEDAQRLIEE